MGKIKRIRQKLHNAAKRNREKETSKSQGDQDMMDCDLRPQPTDPSVGGDNLFKDIKIDSLDLVRQKLPDFDARSTITSKTFKGMSITKKEKKKIRHEAWMAKIEHIKSAEKKTKEKKKKSQTAIVGNLDPMLEALPTLELLMKTSTNQSEKDLDVSKKNRSTQPEKKRKVQMLKDISVFQQVLKHPLFVKDERGTITEHIKIAMEKQVT